MGALPQCNLHAAVTLARHCLVPGPTRVVEDNSSVWIQRLAAVLCSGMKERRGGGGGGSRRLSSAGVAVKSCPLTAASPELLSVSPPRWSSSCPSRLRPPHCRLEPVHVTTVLFSLSPRGYMLSAAHLIAPGLSNASNALVSAARQADWKARPLTQPENDAFTDCRDSFICAQWSRTSFEIVSHHHFIFWGEEGYFSKIRFMHGTFYTFFFCRKIKLQCEKESELKQMHFPMILLLFVCN